ncbi:MAG: hypothetical protein HWE27_02135 [Gammaproteobacteria bacterium]|nr:hypothetical protein [Gammaproteobacteria bacterium]
MFKIAFTMCLTLLISGCGVIPQPVGGSCEYSTRLAEATVTAINENAIEVQVATLPGDDYFRIPKRNRGFRLGEKIQVEVSELTSGACNPFSVRWPPVVQPQNNMES